MINTNGQRRSTAQKTRNTLQQHTSCLYQRVLVLVLMSFLVVSPTWALTINLTFDSGASDSPSFDSSGALLQSIMEAAAAMWEDIIHDSGTLDIEYYYDDLSDAN
ncbi:MAG: hypothetical protein MK179_10590, partial [Pirellulaceae bacterium]|nr:hypothetical protein [Pirellulaceae bacterium]